MKNSKIYLILIGVMFVWGFNVPIVKIVVSHTAPVTITALRIFTAGITVFIILSFLKIVRKPTAQEWQYIVFGALLNVVSHHYFLAVGLTYTSAANAGLILGTGPVLTAILSSILLKKIPTPLRALGFLLGSLGILFTVLSEGGSVHGFAVGDFYLFISILSQALSFIIISKAAKTLDPRLLTGYMLVFGSVILFLISLVKEPGALSNVIFIPGSVWSLFFVSAILATAVGHMLYNFSIGIVGAAEASIFLNLTIFFSLAGSALFLNETITMHHFIGLLFIVSGVLFGSGSVEELIRKRRRSYH